MEILEKHVEYAVVERQAKMLEDLPPTAFGVTLAFSLFVSLTCWICQRMRSKKFRNIEMNFQSQENLLDLKLKEFGGSLPYRNIKELLIGLRNSCAHGDDRNIKPINENGRLVGFRVCVKPSRSKGEITCWLELRLSDLKRIGLRFADEFLKEIIRSKENKKDPNFVSAAHAIKEAA